VTVSAWRTILAALTLVGSPEEDNDPDRQRPLVRPALRRPRQARVGRSREDEETAQSGHEAQPEDDPADDDEPGMARSIDVPMNAARVRRGHRFDHPGSSRNTPAQRAKSRRFGHLATRLRAARNLTEFTNHYVLRPGYDFRTEFEFGLDLILDALEGLVLRSDVGS
jgi:hypothetical protein